jgi:predicted metal-dependent peptidase|tara:strand:- start:21509 stop:22630 length:1122 start_codon:yes stop_codon:yes gene_type:complete
MTTDPLARLSKAKTALILEHPFIGTIAMNMPFKMDDTLDPPTAATNGKRILFHPAFLEDLTDEEVKFVVAHECMHPMLEHNYRRFERDHEKWNRAGDYVINQILVDDQIGKMAPNGLISQEVYDAGGGTSDGVYKILPDDNGDDGLGGEGGAGWQDCEDGEGTQSEKDQQAAEWKVKVAQAAQAAKMMGKMSAGMERLVDEVLNPKVDWRDVLQRFVEKFRNDSRSFVRPNRRFITQGLVLPSPDGETIGELVFAVDCSGSIGDEELAQFAAEVCTVHDDHRPRKLHVIYFDSEVCHYEKFTKDDEVHIEAHGGGGTAFSPVFKYMEEHDIEPVATVFLTDLCCNDFGDEPEHPVLWVSNYGKEAPWGEVVMM